MHTGHTLMRALALLAATQRSDLSTPSTTPSYTDGVCDNDLVAHLPFCNGSLAIDARVDDLVARIPLTEAFGLLVNNASAVKSVHLPAYGWWSEALHGVALSPAVTFDAPTAVATSFPQVISLAASFNRTLFYDVGAAISTEARAFYNQKHAGLTFWTPNVNIFRDPRWGRGQETPGEDPFLTSEYAVAFVRGLQGEASEEEEDAAVLNHTPPQPQPFLKVSATCKHFSAYSQEVPRHRNDAIVTPRDQLDTYLPAFEQCVTRGHVSALMCSYNAVNGVPACADKTLLTDVVRTQWGFDGYIVSDCGAVADILYEHHYTQSPAQTCATTLDAGMDLNCGDFVQQHGKQAFESGLLRPRVVAQALTHLFRVQMRLGMFEQNGQPFADILPSAIDTLAHRQLALEAAQQAIVLLKNDNATLPLDVDALTTDAPLALVGPHANASAALLGNYQGIPSFIATPLESIATTKTPHVVFALGCHVAGDALSDFDAAEQAIAQAARVVLVVGLDQTQEREEIDRTHVALPGLQTELIALALRTATQPIVLVVLAGGSVDLHAYKHDPMVGAIVVGGYLGQSGGQALADVLFGDVNPSGKLTQTFYANEFTNRVSIYDMHMRPTPVTGNPGRTYRFLAPRDHDLAVYWFGDGLSYTQFTVAWQSQHTVVSVDAIARALQPTKTSVSANRQATNAQTDSTTVNMTVTNTGDRAGEYVATVFSVAPDRHVDDGTPEWTLVAFGRTPLLQPQESFQFAFAIPHKAFAVANAHGEWEVRPGTWVLQTGVGPNVEHVQRHEVVVRGAVVTATRAVGVNVGAAADDVAAVHKVVAEPMTALGLHEVEEQADAATAATAEIMRD